MLVKERIKMNKETTKDLDKKIKSTIKKLFLMQMKLVTLKYSNDNIDKKITSAFCNLQLANNEIDIMIDTLD